MILDVPVLREWSVGADATGYLRILDARHRGTPTGLGLGQTRFSSPTDEFMLLYAALDLHTALAEKVVRDRFQGRTQRALLKSDVRDLVIASLVARTPLKLLDIRTSGASLLGIPTDAGPRAVAACPEEVQSGSLRSNGLRRDHLHVPYYECGVHRRL